MFVVRDFEHGNEYGNSGGAKYLDRTFQVLHFSKSNDTNYFCWENSNDFRTPMRATSESEKKFARPFQVFAARCCLIPENSSSMVYLEIKELKVR